MSPILEVGESQEQISLDIRDYLKPFEIARARIYLKGPSFRSRDSLIAKVKKRFLAPWDDTKKLVNFDEHWKYDNQVPPSIKQLKEIGMQEFNLSNGMRVLLCQSRVPYDCAMYGFAYGGLFERDEKNYLSSYFALDITQQLPTFAFNYNLFGGGKIKMNLDIQDYIRSFEALFETDELNVALQLVYLLFCKKPELAKVSVNPMRSKYEMVNEYASEPSFYHKVSTNEDGSQVNVPDAVKFFSECFLDPSQFTVVIVGPLDMKIAATSVQKYLDEDEVLIEYLKAIVEQKIKILLRCEMGEQKQFLMAKFILPPGTRRLFFV
ncbi:zinc protease PQQL-like [Silene latifolia]|uniref:zinc protease PQQL-like n=1 Tax=Silene latifolia TaxID=37657 RepID=UPI003D76CB4F